MWLISPQLKRGALRHIRVKRKEGYRHRSMCQ
nr:MAG TPA: hypothetical protein [Bacteriophage sp.]